MKCQVIEPDHDELVCPAREGGGFRCERTDVHTEHMISEHTEQHALAGNGYACSAFDPATVEADPLML